MSLMMHRIPNKEGYWESYQYKNHYPFELKILIWEKAATIGKKPEVIQRELDKELKGVYPDEDFYEHIPDVRTIKRIIEDINRLFPDVVIAKLPPHLWHLRDDYEAIRSLADKTVTETPLSRELSVTALKIASNLSRYNRSLTTNHDSSCAVGDLVYGGFMYEVLSPGSGQSVELPQVDKTLAMNLLSHLKGEFLELADITDWADLTGDKITEDFIQRLIHRVHKGNFKDT